MKAISLWQPWSSAMACGVKQNETRSWPTSYRGDLVICSAKRKPSLYEIGDIAVHLMDLEMPYGFALCVVELYDCVPTDLFYGATPLTISQAESDLGNYTPGRFAWRTRNLRRLKQPVPLRGYQGIWNLDAETESSIRAGFL